MTQYQIWNNEWSKLEKMNEGTKEEIDIKITHKNHRNNNFKK